MMLVFIAYRVYFKLISINFVNFNISFVLIKKCYIMHEYLRKKKQQNIQSNDFNKIDLFTL